MESQTVASLIRSLIRQFSATRGGVPTVLTKLYRSCHDGGSQPSVESLQTTLLRILETFDDVYIVLDALDECAERKDVLKWVKQTTLWRKSKLHFLATSRLEEDIAMHLRLLDPNHIVIKQDLVSRDIERYIDSILDGENSFRQWGDEIKANIKNTVLKSAGGMYARFYCNKNDKLTVICSRFRLVSLQIDKLQGCLSLGSLEDQLENLPHNLDGVYDRIISGIDKAYHADALKILQWLSFSVRPLKLAEVAQVVGVAPDTNQGLCFKPSQIFADPRSVLMICSSLVTETNGE
jgi:hypothetical protein